MIPHYTKGTHCLFTMNALTQQAAIAKLAAAIEAYPHLRKKLQCTCFHDAQTAPSHVLACRLVNGYVMGTLESKALATLDVMLLLTI